ncbi:MAG TPA: hypothetical protein VHB20_07210 [Verrucomicrobiae bacterium]|jgi:hypothetical protein|nr:hypothetical protein [Verrucomicrobiae bacterium]
MFSRGSRVSQALAGWLIFSIALTSLLAVSPTLHKRFHSDWDQEHHHCFVTSMQKHQVLLSETPPVLKPWAYDLSYPTVFAYFFVPSSRDYRFSPSRAPPAAFSSPA